MIGPRLFLCNGATLADDDPQAKGRKAVKLESRGRNANVNIRLEDVAKVFLKHLSPRLADLLEIAAFVFTADAATRRGTEWADDDTLEPWDRDLSFVIAVRDLSFWQSAQVSEVLCDLLNFLSNDRYTFAFQRSAADRSVQDYLEFAEDDWPFYGVDRVLMFSGGLDSLAGAAETASAGGKLVLVSHRSVATIDSRQRRLFTELRKTFPVSMIHIPVWVNKDKGFGREHTQRTRSFLFAALGTVVGESVKAHGVRFFENGIVSLNLPIADEVLRARASRTTHPKALSLLTDLCGQITGRDFVVDNPYLFKTKADVVSVIAGAGAGHLIGHTCSCTRTGIFQSKTQWHCGACGQCIDRRIAVVAAGQAGNDSETDYVSDVFTGPRKDGYQRNVAVDYARHAIELNMMSEQTIAADFNLEISRAVRSCPKQSVAAQQLVDMHKRHAKTVSAVLEEQLRLHAGQLLDGALDESSMLAMIAGQKHRESAWKRYCDRIVEILAAGLPAACGTHKPKDEPHLQELCDGLLKGKEVDLIREFPFMRWSSSFTKPDWSVESLRLWVELKYVRKKSDIRPITKDIAEDITKYGDNDRRVLYVVYDPHHCVTDERGFSEQIRRRKSMLVRFVR